MRRFFIWSALAAVIGLILAGVAYWAYWTYYARFQPVTVTRNQAEIQRLLDEASWVSAGGGGEPLYIIGYRDSAAMARYEREEIPKLRAAGIEARTILFARPDREGLAQSTAAERATIAELWLTRDWTLYQRWTATPVRNWTAAGIPAADGNLARGAVVDPNAPPPFVAPGDGSPESLPYPTLPPIPPANGATPTEGGEAPAATSGAAPTPAPTRPPVVRAPPEAKKQEDATFF